VPPSPPPILEPAAIVEATDVAPASRDDALVTDPPHGQAGVHAEASTPPPVPEPAAIAHTTSDTTDVAHASRDDALVTDPPHGQAGFHASTAPPPFDDDLLPCRTNGSTSAEAPPSPGSSDTNLLQHRPEQTITPADLPEIVLDRLMSMLSPEDAALISYGLAPNYGTIVLRGGVAPDALASMGSEVLSEEVDRNVCWYHAEIVSGQVIVKADFTVQGNELVKERVSAIAVESVRRIGIDDESGAITYLAGEDEIQISVDADIAAAAIRARIN